MASLLNEANPDAITDVELAPVTNACKQDDPFLVRFAEPFDPDNPKDWRTSRKWAVTDVLSATGFNRIMVSTIMAPALSTIAKEFDMNSAESAMALSIYLLATAFGPLVIGPLSEVYGRKPILHASNVWFLIWNIACGFANSKATLVASRFFAGFGASAIYALANGVLGDVWRPEQRGRSLGVYLLIPLLGAAVGAYYAMLIDFSETRVLIPIFIRTYHRGIHGRPNDLAVDVLGDFDLPSGDDNGLLLLLLGDA